MYNKENDNKQQQEDSRYWKKWDTGSKKSFNLKSLVHFFIILV